MFYQINAAMVSIKSFFQKLKNLTEPKLLIGCYVMHVSTCMSAEYMITMYDTKTQELRWNATYNDYSAPLYDDKKYEYSRSFTTHAQILQASLLNLWMRKYVVFGFHHIWVCL